MTVKWTELFYSIQGEGKYTGRASLFFRFWGCNLECHGFGQDDPTNEDTWVLDFKTFDPKEHEIQSVDELPVWTRGCDSSYTWAQKYAYLATKSTVKEACEAILDALPNRKWGSKLHWVITGGEPMMNQRQITEMMKYFVSIDNYPTSVTIETNGTRELKDEFKTYWANILDDDNINCELNFSVSFKLFSVTGESSEKAVRPHVVNEYAKLSNTWLSKSSNTWLKPVAVDTNRCWEELDLHIASFKEQEYLQDVDVYVMPCGATQEEQEQYGYMKAIAEKSLERGYNFSIRAHVFIWGNAVGT